MEPVSEALSCKFKNMAIVCAIMVVFIHVKHAPAETGSVLWLFDMLVPQGFARIGVPFFFLASGFFLAGHIGEDGWWKRELLKRVRTLLVPFIFWNAAFLLFGTVAWAGGDLLAHRPIGTSVTIVHKPELWFLGLNPFYKAIPLIVTWYIRSLFALIILTPVIAWALKRFPRAFILGAWVLSILADANGWYDVSYCPRFVWEGGLAYFSLGIFLRWHPAHVEGRKLWMGSVILTVALLALRLVQAYTGAKSVVSVGIISIPFMMYTVWGIIPAKRWAKEFTSLAFACYLLHAFILRTFDRIVPAVVGRVGVAPEVGALLEAWIIIVLVVPLTLLLGHAMYRFFPKASGVLFGGR